MIRRKHGECHPPPENNAIVCERSHNGVLIQKAIKSVWYQQDKTIYDLVSDVWWPLKTLGPSKIVNMNELICLDARSSFTRVPLSFNSSCEQFSIQLSVKHARLFVCFRILAVCRVNRDATKTNWSLLTMVKTERTLCTSPKCSFDVTYVWTFVI